MNWVRMTIAIAVVLSLFGSPLAAQEREKTKTKSKDRSGARPGSAAVADSYDRAKIKSLARGKIEFEADGQTITLPVSLAMKVFDADGKEHDPVTGVRFLSPGNIVNIKTKSAAKGSARETTIAEIRFVSGKVIDLPRTKAGADLKPDPKFDGSIIESNTRQKDWDAYYSKAKVGDFIEYRQGPDREPSRREIIEVGSDYVLEAHVFYILGHRDEDHVKRKLFVEQPLPGATALPKKSAPASAPKKTAKTEPAPDPTKTSKSKASSKSAARSSKLSERAKAIAKSKEKSREPAPPPEPETETITVAGRELVCTIRRNSAGTKEWISPEVPFDGMVKDDSRLHYELVNFGRGK